MNETAISARMVGMSLDQKQLIESESSLSATREAASVHTEAGIDLAELKSEVVEENDEKGKELILSRLQKNFPSVSTETLSRSIELQIQVFMEKGLSLVDVLQDSDLLHVFERQLTTRVEKLTVQETEDSGKTIHGRILQLRKEGISLQQTLAALRLEFKGKIDEETDTVLAQFEALFSPELIPDEKERAAVETLFINQGFTEFTPVAFSGFLNTIYEQPDDVISAKTKARIKEQFKPKQKITTGGQLRRVTFSKNEDGEYEHGSPENALLLENGMRAYAQPNGQMAVSFDTPDWSDMSNWIEINIYDWTGERMAKRSNYWLLHTLVHKRFDGMNGLFGGKMNGDGWPEETRDEAVENSARFLRCLVGRREPNHIIQSEDLTMLWSSMDAIVNPKNLSRTENLNDLRDLGILNGNRFNWERLKQAGQILRQNRWFRAQKMKDPVAPFLLLKKELAKLDGHESQKKEKPIAVL